MNQNRPYDHKEKLAPARPASNQPSPVNNVQRVAERNLASAGDGVPVSTRPALAMSQVIEETLQQADHAAQPAFEAAVNLTETITTDALPSMANLDEMSHKAYEAFAPLRQAVSENAAPLARGLIDINNKMLDLMVAQQQALMKTWQSALEAGSVSEAIKVQTSGLREAYEQSSAQIKDIAQTGNSVMMSTLSSAQAKWVPRLEEDA
jgi:hypothetical protein